MNINLRFAALLLVLFLLMATACTKEEVLPEEPETSTGVDEDDEDDDDPEVSLADFSYVDLIDRYEFTSTATGEGLTYKWEVAGNTLAVAFLSDNTATTSFLLPDVPEATAVDVTLTVTQTDGSGSVTTASTTQSVPLPELSWFRKYGWGTSVTSEHSNNVAYDWYVDQAYTGAYSSINCGPACVTMAIQWALPGFTKTTEEARNYYLPSLNGWWFTTDIVNYLGLHNIPNKYIALPNAGGLKTALDAGSIAILCLDMYYIRYRTYEQLPVDKFYVANTVGWGHFIVVKGYKTVNGQELLEVYDPSSSGKRYAQNNALMGIDRLYRTEDILQSAAIWWPNAIVVSKHGGSSAAAFAQSGIPALDPRTVVPQKGR
jgi:hypothetical protein